MRVERALADLEGEPQRLDRARVRFEDSPPPYTSDRSSRSTLSQSPNPPSEEQQRRLERRMQLGIDHRASEPYYQFLDQRTDEKDDIIEADLNRTHRLRVGDNPSKIAYENVKRRWIEQGIWNNKWNIYAHGRWKHEERLELESESETGSEAASSPPPPPLFSFSMEQPQPKPPKPRRPKSDEEKRRIAERRIIREREREASRPFYQFIYQISKEREWIQDEPTMMRGVDSADINTRAYEKVKNTWNRRGIWNRKWSIMPGMSWKHEEPFVGEDADSPAPLQRNPAENGGCEVERAPVLEFANRNLFGTPPVETNNHKVSGAIDTSQHNSSGIEDGDAGTSPSAPNSPRLQTGKRVLRPTKGPSSRKSVKDGQLQPVTSASLGPINPSKASKAATKKKRGSRRRSNVSLETASRNPELSSEPDLVEQLPLAASTPPRRSKRIQQLRSGQPNNGTGTTSTNSPKGRSAGPQGVSKRRSAKKARGRPRKDDT